MGESVYVSMVGIRLSAKTAVDLNYALMVGKGTSAKTVEDPVSAYMVV